MAELVRFGVSIEKGLLHGFDGLIEGRSYSSRSEAIRDLIRQEMVEAAWKAPDADVVATVTLIFDHHQFDLADKLTSIQHDDYDVIISTTHVHLDHDNCLEVLIMHGQASRVKNIADKLIATRGVRHGKTVMTTTGSIFS